MTTETTENVPVGDAKYEFPLANIVLREKNVRSNLPDISDLVASIKSEGIIEPLVGVLLSDGKLELVAGYRRYHAAQQLKLETVPVRTITGDNARRHRVALIENLQRVDMNPMDRAIGLNEMIANEGIEQREVARKLGVSDGYVSQHLALLKLPKKVQLAVRSGQIELAHARQLSRVKNEEKALEFLALAPNLTSVALSDKIDIYLQKEKEKEAKALEAAKKKEKAERRKKLGVKDDDEDEDEAPKTLADEYAEKKLEPLKKTDMMEALKFYASKFERAEAETKKAEYKGILKGLEIAAGLQEFTP